MLIRPAVRLLTFFLVTLAVPVLAAGHRAAILDGNRSLVVVDLESGAVLKKVALPNAPTQMLLTPDRTRIVLLGRGEGKETRDHTFIPTGKASLTIVDLSAMKVIASSELGWGVGDTAFGSGGMLFLLTPGFQSDNANERRPAELLSIDPASGAIVKRVAFTRGADAFGMVGEKLIVFFRAAQNLPAELRFIDGSTFQESAQVVLRGKPEAPVAIPGVRFIYSINTAGNGGVDVISTTDAKIVATLDAGEHPKLGAIDPEGGRLFVLGARTAEKPPSGVISVVRGTSVERTFSLAVYEPTAARLSGDRKWLFVAGEKFKRHFGFREVAVSRIDLATNTAGPAAETAALYPREFATTADGRTMVMFNGGERSCCALTISDLEAGKQIAIMETGSRGKRVAAGLLALGMSGASFYAGRSAAIAHGQSSFTYTIYQARPGYSQTRGPLALSSDGKIAYVLDPATDYLTIADVEKGTKIANFGVGSGVKEVVMLGGGKTVAAVADHSVTLVDTAVNQKGEEISDVGTVTELATSPDGSYGLILGRTKTLLLDGSAKTPRAIPGIGNPLQVIFLE